MDKLVRHMCSVCGSDCLLKLSCEGGVIIDVRLCESIGGLVCRVVW